MYSLRTGTYSTHKLVFQLSSERIIPVDHKSIAWFLPAHNEAENLPTVIPAVHCFLASLSCPFTIIIVNDGSTDNTAEVSEELAKRYFPNVKAVHHVMNLNYGGVVIAPPNQNVPNE